MASSSEYESFIARGKQSSGSKYYNDAAQAFQSAANAALKPDKRIDALDLQIGAMVKTKQLTDALKQAKFLIRIDRRDARGYIRAAQIERLLDRPQAAAQWYSHGLKHVPSTHKHFDLLKTGLEKCEANAVKEEQLAKRSDPFTSLPVEVAQTIIQYFDYRELTAILRVSKGWRMFLQKQDLLIKTLDFSHAKSDVSIKAFKAALRRLNQYPTSVRLTKLTQPARQDAFDRLPSWLRKNTMGLLHSQIPFDKTMIASIPSNAILAEASLDIDVHQLVNLLQQCPSLKRLACRCKESGRHSNDRWTHQTLEELRMSGMDRVAQIINIEMPALRRLDISCDATSATPAPCILMHDLLQQTPKLASLYLETCMIRRSIRFPPTLQVLSMVDMSFVGHGQNVEPSHQNLANLRVLKADLSSWDLPFERFAASDPSSTSAQFEVLDIVDVDVTNDSVALFASMGSLKDLTIRNAYRINGLFVKDLLRQEQGNLERIRLVDCERVAPDTADWASQHHKLRVEVISSRTNYGGKRILA